MATKPVKPVPRKVLPFGRRGAEFAPGADHDEAVRMLEERARNMQEVLVPRRGGEFGFDEYIFVGFSGAGKSEAILLSPDARELKVPVEEVLVWQRASDAKRAMVEAGKSHEEAVAAAIDELMKYERPTYSSRSASAPSHPPENPPHDAKPAETPRALQKAIATAAAGLPPAPPKDPSHTTKMSAAPHVFATERARASAGSPPTPPEAPREEPVLDLAGVRHELAMAAAGSPPPRPPKRGGVEGPSREASRTPRTATATAGAIPPTPPETPRPVRRQKLVVEAGAADISEEIENRARDVAEAKMTREKAELKGFSGWLKKVFVHNYGREIYRQYEIRKAREAILREGNVYAADGAGRAAHVRAVDATVDRILEDYNEFVHTEAGEKREKLGRGEEETAQEKQIKDRLVRIVKAYAADPTMPAGDFEAAKNRILHDAAKLKGVGGEGKMFADNLEQIALRLREHAAHAGGIENVDLELNLTIAKAKLGARTERESNLVDTVLEKMRGNAMGSVVMAAFENEIAYGVAAAHALGSFFATRMASSTLASWSTFGASAGIAGLVAGWKEKSRMHRDRVLHERQRAVGEEVMETNGMTAEEIIAERGRINERIGKLKWHEFGEKRKARAELSRLDRSPRRRELEAHLRDKASATEMTSLLMGMLIPDGSGVRLRSVDVASFSDAASMLAEAEARVHLSDRRGVDLIAYSSVTNVETERRDLDYARAVLKAQLREEYANIDEIEPSIYPSFDDYFAVLRRTAGIDLYGERSENAQKDKAFNALARKKGLWTGAAVAGGAMLIGGAIHEVAGLFAPDAAPSEVVVPRFVAVTETAVERHSFTIPEWLAAHPEVVHAKRDIWFGNNTPWKFDLNELKLWWGGDGQVGVNASGDYIVDMSHMTQAGSVHGAESANAQALLAEGKLKLLISLNEGTQNRPIELTFGADGTIVIPKGSDIAKAAFGEHNGHPVMLGRFTEVAELRSIDASGTAHYGILATREGIGAVGTIDGTTVVTTTRDVLVNDVVKHAAPKLPPFAPFPVPISWRTPLEPMRKRSVEEDEEIVEPVDDIVRPTEEIAPPGEAETFEVREGERRPSWGESFEAVVVPASAIGMVTAHEAARPVVAPPSVARPKAMFVPIASVGIPAQKTLPPASPASRIEELERGTVVEPTAVVAPVVKPEIAPVAPRQAPEPAVESASEPVIEAESDRPPTAPQYEIPTFASVQDLLGRRRQAADDVIKRMKGTEKAAPVAASEPAVNEVVRARESVPAPEPEPEPAPAPEATSVVAGSESEGEGEAPTTPSPSFGKEGGRGDADRVADRDAATPEAAAAEPVAAAPAPRRLSAKKAAARAAAEATRAAKAKLAAAVAAPEPVVAAPVVPEVRTAPAAESEPQSVFDERQASSTADKMIVQFEKMKASIRGYSKRNEDMPADKKNKWYRQILGVNDKADDKAIRETVARLSAVLDIPTQGLSRSFAQRIDQAKAALAEAADALLPGEAR